MPKMGHGEESRCSRIAVSATLLCATHGDPANSDSQSCLLEFILDSECSDQQVR
jgi:hypothetical protein